MTNIPWLLGGLVVLALIAIVFKLSEIVEELKDIKGLLSVFQLMKLHDETRRVHEGKLK